MSEGVNQRLSTRDFLKYRRLILKSAGASTPYIWRIMRENGLGEFSTCCF